MNNTATTMQQTGKFNRYGYMKGFAAAWTGNVKTLVLFRFVFILGLLVSLSFELEHFETFSRTRQASALDFQSLFQGFSPAYSKAIEFWFLAIVAIGVFSAAGIGGRASFILFSFIYFTFVADYLSFTKSPYSNWVQHNYNLPFFCCVYLSLTQKEFFIGLRNLKEKGNNVVFLWACFGVSLLMGFSYLSAAITKIVETDFMWLDGNPLKSFIVERFHTVGLLRAQWILNSLPESGWQLLSLSAISFELTFVFFLGHRKGLKFLALFTTVFTLFNYLFLGINFFVGHFVAVAGLLLPLVCAQNRPLTSTERHIPSVSALVAISILFIMCLAIKAENWPLTRYPMYSVYLVPESAFAIKVFSSNQSGSEINELDVPFVARRKFASHMKRALKKKNKKYALEEIGEVERKYYLAAPQDNCIVTLKQYGWPTKRSVIYKSCFVDGKIKILVDLDVYG